MESGQTNDEYVKYVCGMKVVLKTRYLVTAFPVKGRYTQPPHVHRLV